MFLFNLLNLVVKPRTLTKSNLITVQAKSPVGSEDNEEKFTQKKSNRARIENPIHMVAGKIRLRQPDCHLV